MREFLPKLFSKDSREDRLTMAAINAVAHHVPVSLVADCKEYVYHNEPEHALVMLTDRLVMDGVQISRSAYECLEMAIRQYSYSLDEMSANLALIKVERP